MIRLVTGPPASGKSTYVRENAKPTDAIIDLDLLDGDSTLRAALEESLHLKGSRTDVWVCRTLPDPKDRNGFAEYIQADEVVLLDDSTEDELIARLEGTEDAEARREGIRRWFSLNPRNGERKETESMSENSTAPEAQQPVAEELSTPASEDVQAQVEELKKQVEQWKSHSRTWEKRAKESQHNTESEQTDDGEQLKNLQEEFATFKRESALRIAESEKIPVMMVNGRISDRSMKRYRYISAFTREMLSSIERFCMQSNFDAEYIAQLGANPDEITVTGNMKYDQTYATVSEEEKQALLDEFGFGHNHPIIVAGSTHKGEDEAVFESFKQVLVEYPNARLLIAPREIYRGHDVQTLAKHYGLEAICRSDMTEPVHKEIPVVVLDTIGELGRLYSLGDIIFVGGSLVKTGGHNILEPAAHGKPIIVGPHMFNFKEIFNLLHSRHACEQVKNQKDLTTMILHLCKHPELAKEMGQNCLDIIRENRGATRRNTQELRQLFESHHIIP